MAKSLPPLNWFRAFEAAGRHLSFTAAAEEIGMTQSAVSQQIKALETRLGVALFTRHARGLALTDEARKLMPQVGAALGQLTAATQAFDAGPTENQLTIAASVSIAQWVIAPRLPSFRAAHPQVRLRFLSTIWPDDFQTARADVTIRFGSAAQVGAGAQLLEPNALIPLKAPGLKGALKDLPLIEAVGTSAGWAAWEKADPGGCRPSVFADSYGMALHLAAHGNGVALVSALLTGHALAEGTLVLAALGSIVGQEGYYLSVQESNAAAVQFRDWLLAQLPVPDVVA